MAKYLYLIHKSCMYWFANCCSNGSQLTQQTAFASATRCLQRDPSTGHPCRERGCHHPMTTRTSPSSRLRAASTTSRAPNSAAKTCGQPAAARSALAAGPRGRGGGLRDPTMRLPVQGAGPPAVAPAASGRAHQRSPAGGTVDGWCSPRAIFTCSRNARWGSQGLVAG